MALGWVFRDVSYSQHPFLGLVGCPVQPGPAGIGNIFSIPGVLPHPGPPSGLGGCHPPNGSGLPAPSLGGLGSGSPVQETKINLGCFRVQRLGTNPRISAVLCICSLLNSWWSSSLSRRAICRAVFLFLVITFRASLDSWFSSPPARAPHCFVLHASRIRVSFARACCC